MNRSSVFSVHRIVTVFASMALVLLVAASAFFLTRQRPIPVTGPAEAEIAAASTSPRLYLGTGNWLENGQVVDLAEKQSSVSPRQYLGTGYWLENGQIVK